MTTATPDNDSLEAVRRASRCACSLRLHRLSVTQKPMALFFSGFVTLAPKFFFHESAR